MNDERVGLEPDHRRLNDLPSTTLERLQSHQSTLDTGLGQARALAAETTTASLLLEGGTTQDGITPQNDPKSR